MNSDKQTRSSQRGNALIYVIIALALLGALTMLLTKESGESDDLTYEKSELLALKATALAAVGTNTVNQMVMSGTKIDNLIYLRPNQAGYGTPPHYNKVFHPEGGGMTYPAPDPQLFGKVRPTSTFKPGWYMNRFQYVEWAPLAHLGYRQILFSAYDIKQSVCAAINRKLTGSATIPQTQNAAPQIFLSPAGEGASTSTYPLSVTECPGCEGHLSLCVEQPASPPLYTYYNVIVAQ